jgi:ATP-dependent helicase HrpB
MSRLVTEPISQASAEQRAGRAGRLGPGHCLRLWTAEAHRRRPAQRPAEILDADLAPMALELALWGISEPGDLRWLDPPPSAAWSRAVELLRTLDALDHRGQITALGRAMAALPVHPRLAAMLCRAPRAARPLACDLAALLSERDPWIGGDGLPRPADLGLRLGALAASRRGDARSRGGAGFDPRRLGAVARAAAQLHRLIEGAETATQASAATSADALLALAYPDRIAQNRGRDGRFLLRAGVGATLPPDDALRTAAYLVVADLAAGTGDHRIRAALATDRTLIETLFEASVETTEQLGWDSERGAVSARREIRLGALTLQSRPAPLQDRDAALTLLLREVGRDLENGLAWTPQARQFQARVTLARRLEPEDGWQDLSDAALSEALAEWLGPWLTGKSRLI